MSAVLAAATLSLLAAVAAYGAKDDLTLVSHSLAGPPTRPNDRSQLPVISRDGRYVVFTSKATNMAPGATNGILQVMRWDRLTGAIELVSRADGPGGAQGDDVSGDDIGDGSIDVSADGRFVAFESVANNLRNDDTDTIQNIYVRDMLLGQTLLVSRNDADQAALTDGSRDPSVSDDGSRVAFTSIEQAGASNMPGNPAEDDVLVRDLGAGTTTVASVADDEGQATDRSGRPSLSGDGTRVTFFTDAGNLGADVSDPSDPDGRIVLRDMAAGTTQVVSILPDGQQLTSFSSDISRDGRHVGFLDPNGRSGFLRNLAAGTTIAVTRADGPDGAITNEGFINGFDLSGDGRFVSFATSDDDTSSIDDDGTDPFDDDSEDVFVRDTALNRTIFVSRANGPDGAPQETADVFGASIDAAGRYVAFDTTADNLSDDDYNGPAVFKSDVFLRDLGDPPPIPQPQPGGDPFGPVITNASLRFKTFGVARRPTALSGQRRRRAPRGTRIRFTLSEQAKVRIAVERRGTGLRRRRAGRVRCVRARRPAVLRAPRRARCALFRRVGTFTRRNRPAGRNSVAFSGRLGRRALRRGRHRFVLSATDAAGNPSTSKPRLAFRIVR
jgi:Tol biopolymer transport system component